MTISEFVTLFTRPSARAAQAVIDDLEAKLEERDETIELQAGLLRDADAEIERVTTLLGQALNLVFTIGDALRPFVGTLTMKGLTTDRRGVEFTGDLGVNLIVVPSDSLLRFTGEGVVDLELHIPAHSLTKGQQNNLLAFVKRVELAAAGGDPVADVVPLVVAPVRAA